MDRDALRYVPSLVVAGLVLLGMFFFAQLVIQLRIVLGVLFLGVIIGVTLSPLTDYLARYRVPRPLSVVGVYAGTALVISLFLWYAIDNVASEIDEIIGESDQIQADYDRLADDYGLPAFKELGPLIEERLGSVSARLAMEAQVAVDVLLYTVTVFVVAVFYTTTKRQGQTLILSVMPAEHRLRTAEVLDSIGHRLRQYVLGQLLQMTLIGVITFVGLTLLGVRFALVLAVIAFLLELVPLIGPILSAVPAIALAMTQGVDQAIYVLLLYIGVQQLESNVITPVVQRKQTDMPELLILAAVLIGGALMGILGTLVGLPLAVILYTLAVELIIPWRQKQTGWLGDNEPEPEPQSEESSEPIAIES